VKVIQETDYPNSGHVTIRVDPSRRGVIYVETQGSLPGAKILRCLLMGTR